MMISVKTFMHQKQTLAKISGPEIIFAETHTRCEQSQYLVTPARPPPPHPPAALRTDKDLPAGPVRVSVQLYSVYSLLLCVVAPHTTSVARLPGRNSGQKAQKGPQKKISGRNLADLTKNRQKRGRRKFSKKFLIFSCDNHV